MKRIQRIRQIKRENTKIRRLGRGRYELRMVIAHQSFALGYGTDTIFSSRERANWFATQLAIALNRFKHGD